MGLNNLWNTMGLIKMSNINVVLDIDRQGNVHTLYTDDIDLFAVGLVTNIRKASNVEFCEPKQCWQVISLDGEVLYEHSNREVAIEWEIEKFGVGGIHYNG